MPTKQQLYRIWESEFGFSVFDREDEKFNVRGSAMAGIGKGPLEVTGEVIGVLEINKETGDIKMIPNLING